MLKLTFLSRESSTSIVLALASSEANSIWISSLRKFFFTYKIFYLELETILVVPGHRDGRRQRGKKKNSRTVGLHDVMKYLIVVVALVIGSFLCGFVVCCCSVEMSCLVCVVCTAPSLLVTATGLFAPLCL